MSVVLVTGASGLIGSETVRFFADKGLDVVGIDNDMRQEFFGAEASTDWMRQKLEATVPGYTHVDEDIRDQDAMGRLYKKYGTSISSIIHCASQPSHDWAARDPHKDFTVNANGTLVLLELTRQTCPDASFIFTSTNKVYGDTPNRLPLVELDKRWELDEAHDYYTHGIDEQMSIDHAKHSLFGVSKAAADIMVQEYGRYFDMHTTCLRGGCLTGPAHSGTQLHGFLSYLVKCAVTGTPYTVIGYKGKQVRDNIHAYDFVNAMWHIFEAPKIGKVYNMGGARHSNCSMMEAIETCERLTGRDMNWSYEEANRIGDHIWWISDTRAFQADYPSWGYTYDIDRIMGEIHGRFAEEFA